MELHELGNRLFRLHAKLILVCLVAGVLAGLALSLSSKPQYQASALLTMGSPDPQSAEVAGGLADTARGIATGPQLVNYAIDQVGAHRNENKVAAAITIQTQGISGVVMLSVTDRDPQVAIGLANALAAGVVSTRAELNQNSKEQSIRSLNQQEASTQAQIQKLNDQVGKLATQSSTSAIAQLSALEARLTTLQGLAGQIIVQETNLESQFGPEAKVIDPAASATGIHTRLLDNALLGGLLGLVLGIAAAAVREVTRPSLVGPTAVSRAVGAPLLGDMSTQPDSWTVAALPDAGSYIELAAEAKNVQEVRFAALDPKHRGHRARVRMLEGPLQRLRLNRPRTRERSAVSADNGRSAGLAPAAVADLSAADQDGRSSPRTGLVVAVPKVLKQADVDPLTNFIWISGWNLLGVITYPPPRKAITTARGTGSANPGRDTSVDQQAEVDTW
jgi:capsular polysaccharide biosynthesis protein